MIFGFLGMGKAGRPFYKGKGMGRAGLVLGAVGIVGGILFILLVAVGVNPAVRQRAGRLRAGLELRLRAHHRHV